MKKQHGFQREEFLVVALLVVLVIFISAAIAATAKKQAEDQGRFMASCLQEKKQYECDVLWNQTAESKQNRDLAIGLAAGAAIGAAAGRR